jgi:hypothetical protein
MEVSEARGDLCVEALGTENTEESRGVVPCGHSSALPLIHCG